MATGQQLFDSIENGLKFERKIEVGEDRVITFMGDDLRVYETPSMIADMEYACRDLLHEHLPSQWDSVGVVVDIEHLAATPIHQSVTVKVEIIEITGRKVRFKCEVCDALEIVGRGYHERFIVNVEKHRLRIAEKRTRMQ
ncbi:MAG: thioesterase family protein [Acidiferrobacterales bacterium]|nr:thioesterase family protein [Acidiferrobacterales bacterium]